MRKFSPDFLPLVAGVLSVLVIAVPVGSLADPSEHQPRASDTNTDSQTSQRDIQQQYQHMGAAQQESQKRMQDRSLHQQDPNTREEDHNTRQHQRKDESKNLAPEH
jgi:hypothetical protein